MKTKLFALILTLLLPLAAQAQQYSLPSPQEMQAACTKTNGTWRVLAAECDNMHPRSWKKLTPEQRLQCQESFNEPCHCGAGRRFSIVQVLGCIPSKFPQDQ
jgi:hypothetical protein